MCVRVLTGDQGGGTAVGFRRHQRGQQGVGRGSAAAVGPMVGRCGRRLRDRQRRILGRLRRAPVRVVTGRSRAGRRRDSYQTALLTAPNQREGLMVLTVRAGRRRAVEVHRTRGARRGPRRRMDAEDVVAAPRRRTASAMVPSTGTRPQEAFAFESGREFGGAYLKWDRRGVIGEPSLICPNCVVVCPFTRQVSILFRGGSVVSVGLTRAADDSTSSSNAGLLRFRSRSRK